MKRRIASQAGDTIIEVLVAIAVLSGAIGIGYASASRSSNIAQQSQERGDALQIAQSQIEQLRSSANTSEEIFTVDGQSFCMDLPTIVRQPKPPTSEAEDDFSTYNTQCRFGPNTDKRYYTSVIYTPDDLTTNTKGTFTVRVRWEKLGGASAKQEVKIVYRLHRAQFTE